MRGIYSSAAIGALAVALIGLGGCGKAKPAKPAELEPTVTVSTVQMRPLQGGLSASGLLVSREEAGVSSELAGYRIAQVPYSTVGYRVAVARAYGAYAYYPGMRRAWIVSR